MNLFTAIINKCLILYYILVFLVYYQTYQTIIKGEYPHIPAVVNVVPPHDWICVVLDPNAGERVPAYLVILICSLGIIRHIQSHILTIRYITMSDHRIRTDATYTNSGTNCKKKNTY